MMQQTRAKNTFHYHFTLWCFFKISNRPYASHSLSFPTAICLAVRCSFLPTLFLISGQSGASLAYSRIIASSSCDHRPRPVFGASTYHSPHAPAPFSDSLELSSVALLAGVGVGLSAWCSFSSSSSDDEDDDDDASKSKAGLGCDDDDDDDEASKSKAGLEGGDATRFAFCGFCSSSSGSFMAFCARFSPRRAVCEVEMTSLPVSRAPEPHSTAGEPITDARMPSITPLRFYASEHLRARTCSSTVSPQVSSSSWSISWPRNSLLFRTLSSYALPLCPLITVIVSFPFSRSSY